MSENRRNKILIFLTMYLGNFLFYSTRKTFAMITPKVDALLSFKVIGMVFVVLNLAYAASKFINGFISDRVRSDYFMALGLFLVGFAHIAISLFMNTYSILPIMFLNGVMLSVGWSVCTKILSFHFEDQERGFFWSMLTSAKYVGVWVSTLFLQISTRYMPWQGAFFIIGSFCILGSFIVFYLLRHLTQGESISSSSEKKKPAFRDVYTNILTNRSVLVLVCASICLYIVRSSVENWLPMYLRHVKHYSQSTMLFCISFFEIGSILGCICIGRISDTLFKANRAFTMLVATAFYAFFLFMMYMVRDISIVWLDASLIATTAFFIAGPQMLFGLACVERCTKNLAGSVNGFMGTISYACSAIGSFVLGSFTKGGSFFFVLTFIAILGIILLLPVARPAVAEEETTN